MRVDAYGGDAAEAEIKGFAVEAGFGEEGDEEGAEAAVYVQGGRVAHGEAGEAADVVDYAVWEVWGGADQEDGVWVY